MPKDDLPWFHCYPSKWLGALAAMQPDEGYLYIIVCLRIYEKRGPIQDDARSLSKRTGFYLPKVERLILGLLKSGKLFRTKDGCLMNKFAADEIEDGVQRLQRTSSIRSAAANNRWRKTQRKQRNADANAMQTDADLDLDLEIDKKDPTPKGVGVARANKRRRRTESECQIPNDFALTIADLEHASKHGFGRQQATRLFEAFFDHHRAKGTLMLDWHAAWRTWVRNEVKFSAARTGQRRQTDSRAKLLLEAMEDATNDDRGGQDGFAGVTIDG